MNTKFKRHQKVKLLRAPLIEDVEPYTDPPTSIREGMTGKINLILPNGQYHIDIIDEKTGETIAYCAMDEEGIEPLDDKPSGHTHNEKPEDWAGDK